MNGIIIVDKPKDYTSRDVVNIISHKLGTKKVGHTGTLDPIATGVLVVCVGKALKLTELLTNEVKEYIARVRLGIETDTLDITGNVIHDSKVPSLSDEEIIDVLNKFKGSIVQEVPKYSAIKVRGKKLYEYARENIEVELPKREVKIFEIELLERVNNCEFIFRCVVSKGTYIRSLIRDIGYALNNYATMTDLRRTKQGKFVIDDSFTINYIESDNYKLLNPSDVVDLPKRHIRGDLLFRVRNGQKLDKFFDEDMIMLLDDNDELVAIYRQDRDNDKVRAYKVF